MSHPLRLGAYVDAVFSETAGGRVATNSEGYPFMTWLVEVGAQFESLTIIGRSAPAGAGAEFVLGDGPRLHPLPFYASLRHVWQLAGALARSVVELWRAAGKVDVVWVFGPHPLGLLLALFALARGRQVALGVRQDTMPYFRARLPSARWKPVIGGLSLMNRAFIALARRVPTVVVGAELERVYGGPRPGLLKTTVCLIRRDEMSGEARRPGGSAPLRLFTAGRIEPEKNPLLLVEALGALDATLPDGACLAWAGTGRMESRVSKRAGELGVGDRLELLGFVPFGPELLGHYGVADVFVHVSLTEGVPQTIVEAMSSGTPVVATAVGSVADLLEGGRAGLLVPPGDREALVRALVSVLDDPEAAVARAERALELTRSFALDVETRRVAAFVASAEHELAPSGP